MFGDTLADAGGCDAAVGGDQPGGPPARLEPDGAAGQGDAPHDVLRAGTRHPRRLSLLSVQHVWRSIIVLRRPSISIWRPCHRLPRRDQLLRGSDSLRLLQDAELPQWQQEEEED